MRQRGSMKAAKGASRAARGPSRFASQATASPLPSPLASGLLEDADLRDPGYQASGSVQEVGSLQSCMQ